MIVESAREVSIERGRLRVVLATIAINIVAVSLLVVAPWSNWRTGLALNLVDNCLLVGFALVRRDELLGRFVIFGLAVGITELAADAGLVDYTRNARLFSGRRPMIWRSPLWKPLAWEVVALQFGYIGLRFWERFDKVGLHRGRIVNLGLLHRRVLHYGSIISVNFTVLSSAKDITQLVFGSFQNALLLLWKIFAGAIDVEI